MAKGIAEDADRMFGTHRTAEASDTTTTIQTVQSREAAARLPRPIAFRRTAQGRNVNGRKTLAVTS